MAFLVDNHTESYYKNTFEFNSDSGSWYIPSPPEKATDIYLRRFVETNDLILIFQIENNEDLKDFSLIKSRSPKESKDFLNKLNMPNEKIKKFISNGIEYCFIFKEDGKYYLVSKYDLNKKINVMIINLNNKEKLDICE
ncbi:hypothetical protein NSA18_07985 [Pasteurella caecimuris]|nr:hypothetical protein [Pasteurella caecimuris]